MLAQSRLRARSLSDLALRSQGPRLFAGFTWIGPFKAGPRPTRSKSWAISPGGPALATATAVSNDGNIIVGYGTPTEGTPSAMIWTPALRMRELKAVLLIDFGIDISAATLREARGISADGLVIAGLGRRTAGVNLVGWVVDLRDAGSPCLTYPADYNQDGGTTGDDVAAFFTDFEQGFPCADTNLDGGVTGNDEVTLFITFEQGGC